VSERLARFRESPNERDARKLGDLRLVEGYPAEAVAYYRRAASLNPSSETDYDLRTFGAMARGAYSQLYSVGELSRQADVVVANADATDSALWEVLWTMQKVSHKTSSPGIWHPYLKAAYERTSDEGKFAEKRNYIAADYVLHIENDPVKALATKRASMPEGWQESSRYLNNFAWWCFENRLDLDEARELAERGVELAEAGTEKANVLDTLAELCNVSNDCANAVGYIRLAIEEDPDNEYFRKQLVRFEEILAMQE
jgi:tetratricopeptide (TPR) repeat protein